MIDERRRFQRLSLVEPLDGWFGDFAVRLIDVSATGALIESDEPIPADSRALLRFYWRGAEIEITAETARAGEQRAGLQFVEESAQLWALIEESANELLRALEANARGDRDANLVGDQTFTSAMQTHASGYVTWTFGAKGWKSHAAMVPDQPENGFTIPASEDAEQVEMLCRTYEHGDDEARRLTRMLAELSVAGNA
ncbi:MAG TPA: PilZ domain-containing protein [Thermoanaerobaculia bacterium]|nr:PilZ domain-containing protein [Thermoanaerobaculia bacterium]